MVAIIPAKYHVELRRKAPEIVIGGAYFLQKIFGDRNMFEPVGLSDDARQKMKEIISSDKNSMNQKIASVLKEEELVKILGTDESDLVETIEEMQNDVVLLHKGGQPALVILHKQDSRFFIIASSVEQGRNLANAINNKCMKLDEITRDFGVTLTKVSHGADYADWILHFNEKIQSIIDKEPKNELERNVIAHISRFTDCIKSNVEVKFSEPPESFEYDILLPFGTENTINIEVTDYTTARKETHADADSLKSKVILQPLDKAKRLKASVIIIADGFPPDTFQQMRELAYSRNASLYSADDYAQKIEVQILHRLLSYYTRVGTRSIERYSTEILT